MQFDKVQQGMDWLFDLSIEAETDSGALFPKLAEEKEKFTQSRCNSLTRI